MLGVSFLMSSSYTHLPISQQHCVSAVPVFAGVATKLVDHRRVFSLGETFRCRLDNSMHGE